MSRYYSKRYKKHINAKLACHSGWAKITNDSYAKRKADGVQLVRSPWGYFCRVRGPHLGYGSRVRRVRMNHYVHSY